MLRIRSTTTPYFSVYLSVVSVISFASKPQNLGYLFSCNMTSDHLQSVNFPLNRCHYLPTLGLQCFATMFSLSTIHVYNFECPSLYSVRSYRRAGHASGLKSFLSLLSFSIIICTTVEAWRLSVVGSPNTNRTSLRSQPLRPDHVGRHGAGSRSSSFRFPSSRFCNL